jgi:hypothetical protein
MVDIQALGDERSPINMVIYGEPGVGKTALAGTWAMVEDSDILWASIEGGLLTLHDMPFKSSVDVQSISGVGDLEDLHKFLKYEEHHYVAVVIDNATEIIDRDLEVVVHRKAAKDVEKFGKSRRATIDDVWMEDYGETSRRLARVFRWYRDLPIHTIFIAHPRHIEAKRGDRNVLVDVRPDFPRQLRRAVEGYVDFVWFLHQTEEGERLLYTKRTGVLYCKSRGIAFDPLPALRVPWGFPTMPEVLSILNGKEPSEHLIYTEEESQDESERSV